MPQRDQNHPDNVLRWVRGEAPADVDLIEYEVEAEGGTKYQRRLYRDTIKRKVDGQLKEQPICLRVPDTRDRTRATLQALKWAQAEVEAEGIEFRIQGRGDAEGLLGAERFEELYTKALVARCVHEPREPYTQWLMPHIFNDVVPHESCGDLWERIDYYRQYEDPRLSELSEEQMMALVATIAQRRNASPLVGIAGTDKLRFIVFMAERLQSYQSAKSS